jgi:exodeoxyribonuclease VII small subunit
MSPTAKSPAKSISPPQSFEADLSELEAIVATMESGQVPLQESLDAYKRGIALLRRCQDTLTAAEQQISILDASGQRVELRPYDPESEADQND